MLQGPSARGLPAPICHCRRIQGPGLGTELRRLRLPLWRRSVGAGHHPPAFVFYPCCCIAYCISVLPSCVVSSFLFFFGPLFECVCVCVTLCVCVLPVCGPPGATATRSASSLSPVVSCAHTWGANPATYRLRGAHGWWALFCRLRGFCYSPFCFDPLEVAFTLHFRECIHRWWLCG